MAAQIEPRRIALMLDLDWPLNYHVGIFAGTQRYAGEQEWHSIIDEFAHDTLPAKKTRKIPYDGIIARANRQLAERAARLGIPVVNVWKSSPAVGLLPGVFPDYAIAGRMRAEHLLTRGFREFAAVTSPKNYGQYLDLGGFRRTVEEAGFSCRTELVPQNPTRNLASWRKTENALANFVNSFQSSTGLFAGDETVGRMLAQICDVCGLRVPEDVAIIAGNNDKILCEHPHPSLTSIEMGFERIGYETARLLHELMDGKKPPDGPILLPPQGIVVRESTDFFAVEDQLVAAALAFISANSHRRIGQDDVSRAVSAETRTLQLRFRKFLNRPIATEIRRVRIERAKRELAQSKRRLSDIARDVGFGKTMRMYEVFRRELGITPSEYRRKHQMENGT